MDLNLSMYSKEFQFFYYAFDFNTHGISMGRAAEHAADDFPKLSAEEQKIGIEWFLYLFSQEHEYYAESYFKVIRYSKDARFLPYLKDYYKRLKKKNRKCDKETIYIKPFVFRTGFDKELSLCKATINELKKQRVKK